MTFRPHLRRFPSKIVQNIFLKMIYSLLVNVAQRATRKLSMLFYFSSKVLLTVSRKKHSCFSKESSETVKRRLVAIKKILTRKILFKRCSLTFFFMNCNSFILPINFICKIPKNYIISFINHFLNVLIILICKRHTERAKSLTPKSSAKHSFRFSSLLRRLKIAEYYLKNNSK